MDLSRIDAPYVAAEALYGSGTPIQADALSPARSRRRGLHPLLLAGPPVANLADAYTTRLAHNFPNIREGNPAIRPIAESDALYAVKGGVGVGTSLGAELLARSGHRNWGKGLAILGTVLPLAAAGWNLTQMDRASRSMRSE